MFHEDGTKHLPPITASAGPATGFAENFKASYNDQVLNGSSFGMEYEFSDQVEVNNDLIYEKTGKRFDSLIPATFYDLAQELEGVDEADRRKRNNDVANSMYERAKQQQAELEALKANYPEIKTFNEIWDNVKVKSKKLEGVSHDVSNRSGVAGTLGAFAGGVVGSFTYRDPLNIATLGLGGIGKSAGSRILSEAMIAGGVESGNQFFAVQKNRKLLGRDFGFKQALQNTIFAGAGAGIFRGAGEGVAAGGKKVASKLESIAEGLSKKPATTWTNRQTLKALDKLGLNKTSHERATIGAIEREMSFDEVNPFGKEANDATLHKEKFVETAEAMTRRFDESFDARAGDTPPTEFAPGTPKLNHFEQEFMEEARGIINALEESSKIDFNKPKTLESTLGYKPVSLSEFIKKSGGIVDYGGELKSRGINNKVSPGLLRKSKKSGGDSSIARNQQADYVKERVYEAGYFPSKRDYNEISDSELYDAIAQDRLSDKVYDGDTMFALNEYASNRVTEDSFSEFGITSKSSVAEVAEVLRTAAKESEEFIAPNDIDAIFKELGLDDAELRNREGHYTEEEKIASVVEATDSAQKSLESDIQARVNRALDNDGQTVDFGFDDTLDIDAEMVSGIRFDPETGDKSIETRTIRDLLDDFETDDELLQSMKVCGL